MLVVDDCGRTIYDDIGGHKKFAGWARQNLTDFDRISGRLIPAENAGNEITPIGVEIASYGNNHAQVVADKQNSKSECA